MRKTIKEVISILDYQAKKKGVKIHTFFKNFENQGLIEENPTSSLFDIQENHNYLIYSDEQRLVQVIMNLLSNALKFTSKGGTITLNCQLIRDHKSFVKISVKDTGCGISKEDQTKLFKLFGFLKSSEKKNTKGIGLGLYISSRIVESFKGGKIDLESEL